MTAETDVTPWTVEALLGGLSLEEVLGHPVEESATEVRVEPYAFGSPATAALQRVRGRRPDGGGDWTAFVKVLQHLRHWPMLQFMPPPAAEAFVKFFPWREEVTLWAYPFEGAFPVGMRIPDLYRVVDLGDDRLAVWTEEVVVDDSPWDEHRFARAAGLLARLNATLSTPEAIASTGYEPGFGLGQWVMFGLPQGLGPLADDDLWSGPLAGNDDLRAGLQEAATMVEDVRVRLNALPQGRPHGDASPQNLLVPADGSADFVAIDLSFQTPAPLGSDLAQLVVGLGHAGLLAPDRLPSIEAAVLEAYAAASPATAEQVACAYAGTLLLRSGFTAIPYTDLGSPQLPQRLALTRFILDAARLHLP